MLHDVEQFMQKKGCLQSAFEKDYSTIVNVASFRRLQDKTQVFPLDKSDFVRTRLTHSIETSTIAKRLGIMAINIIKNRIEQDNSVKEKDTLYEKIRNIPDMLMCAGLLHDIGNPPFGHFGETIIGDWFKENLKNIDYKEKKITDCLSEQMLKDLYYFEGNSQALRLITKLHYFNNDNGMNLTSAVLNTIIKYPCSSLEKQSKDIPEEYKEIKKKKIGYFYAETNVFNQISTETGAGNCRHPLVYLLEAADDIAYNTSDIEDGFNKGLFTFSQLDKFLKDRLNFYKTEINDTAKIDKIEFLINKLSDLKKAADEKFKGYKGIKNIDLIAVQNWVKYVQGWLAYCAMHRFDKKYDDIMHGKYNHDLLFDSFHEYSVKILSDFMKEFIYPNNSILKLELSGKTILSFLLKSFVSAVLYFDEDKDSKYKQNISNKKLVNLISDNYIAEYRYASKDLEDEGEKLYLRILLVTDFLSGMTDSYAKNLYRELSGIV